MTQESPTDEEYEEDQIRSAEEIARRAIVLHSLVASAHGVDKKKIFAWLKKEGLSEDVSPEEWKYFENEDPPQQSLVNATWRVEALVGVAWSIGAIQDLDPLTDMCDTDRIIEALPDLGSPTSEFIRDANLRPEKEIEDEYEKIYHSHWKVRDAQLNGKTPPENLNPSVVRERHYGMNWIIGYCGQEWDEISTDT